MSTPGSGMVGRPRSSAAAVIHRHFQVYGNARLAIRQILDAHDLGHRFAIHGIMRGAERESDENPHALVVRFPARGEVDPFLGCIHTDRQVLKVVVPGIRRPHTNRPGDFRPVAESFYRILFSGGFLHRCCPRKLSLVPVFAAEAETSTQ